MTYQEALAYLASLSKFGIMLGLSRIERLLAAMGNPEKQYKTVHVTGTNGKGSTTAMLAAMLSAGGVKTAMYTSPHLTSYTERMVIDGQAIVESDFAAAIAHTRRFVERLVAAGGEQPTEFEVLTAAAFYAFAAAGVDYAVIEVGLGGLLDSTNVIIPEVSVITNVSIEHTDRCGHTVTEIAGHKAGIIKDGVPVVTAAQGEALAVIQQQAAARHAQVHAAGLDFTADNLGSQQYQQQLRFMSRWIGCSSQLAVNLLGDHQVDNAAVALEAFYLLATKDRRISRDAAASGLAAVAWPGRLEVFSGSPLLVLDGAHNPAGAGVLRQALDRYFAGKPRVFLTGILHDKDVEGILSVLIRPEDKVVVVAPDSERAEDPAVLAAMITAVQVETAPTIADGLARAQALCNADDLLCVAGSLYLIGAVRPLVLSGQIDNYPI